MLPPITLAPVWQTRTKSMNLSDDSAGGVFREEKAADMPAVVPMMRNATALTPSVPEVVYEPVSEDRPASTQIDIPADVASVIVRLGETIPDDHLAEKGREKVPHITCKYGVLADHVATGKAVQDFGPINYQLGKFKVFQKEEYDVLWLDVISPELHQLNALLCRLPCVESDYRGYTPHVTVAYVQPGLGEVYAAAWNGAVQVEAGGVAEEITYSGPDRVPVSLRLCCEDRAGAVSPVEQVREKSHNPEDPGYEGEGEGEELWSAHDDLMRHPIAHEVAGEAMKLMGVDPNQPGELREKGANGDGQPPAGKPPKPKKPAAPKPVNPPASSGLDHVLGQALANPTAGRQAAKHVVNNPQEAEHLASGLAAEHAAGQQPAQPPQPSADHGPMFDQVRQHLADGKDVHLHAVMPGTSDREKVRITHVAEGPAGTVAHDEHGNVWTGHQLAGGELAVSDAPAVHGHVAKALADGRTVHVHAHHSDGKLAYKSRVVRVEGKHIVTEDGQRYDRDALHKVNAKLKATGGTKPETSPSASQQPPATPPVEPPAPPAGGGDRMFPPDHPDHAQLVKDFTESQQNNVIHLVPKDGNPIEALRVEHGADGAVVHTADGDQWDLDRIHREGATFAATDRATYDPSQVPGAKPAEPPAERQPSAPATAPQPASGQQQPKPYGSGPGWTAFNNKRDADAFAAQNPTHTRELVNGLHRFRDPSHDPLAGLGQPADPLGGGAVKPQAPPAPPAARANDPAQSTADAVKAGFDGLASGIKGAAKAKTDADVAKRGYTGFRNQAAADMFASQNPDWKRETVNGEHRFSPPSGGEGQPGDRAGAVSPPAPPRPPVPIAGAERFDDDGDDTAEMPAVKPTPEQLSAAIGGPGQSKASPTPQPTTTKSWPPDKQVRGTTDEWANHTPQDRQRLAAAEKTDHSAYADQWIQDGHVPAMTNQAGHFDHNRMAAAEAVLRARGYALGQPVRQSNGVIRFPLVRSGATSQPTPQPTQQQPTQQQPPAGGAAPKGQHRFHLANGAHFDMSVPPGGDVAAHAKDLGKAVGSAVTHVVDDSGRHVFGPQAKAAGNDDGSSHLWPVDQQRMDRMLAKSGHGKMVKWNPGTKRAHVRDKDGNVWRLNMAQMGHLAETGEYPHADRQTWPAPMARSAAALEQMGHQIVGLAPGGNRLLVKAQDGRTHAMTSAEVDKSVAAGELQPPGHAKQAELDELSEQFEKRGMGKLVRHLKAAGVYHFQDKDGKDVYVTPSQARKALAAGHFFPMPQSEKTRAVDRLLAGKDHMGRLRGVLFPDGKMKERRYHIVTPDGQDHYPTYADIQYAQQFGHYPPTADFEDAGLGKVHERILHDGTFHVVGDDGQSRLITSDEMRQEIANGAITRQATPQQADASGGVDPEAFVSQVVSDQTAARRLTPDQTAQLHQFLAQTVGGLVKKYGNTEDTWHRLAAAVKESRGLFGSNMKGFGLALERKFADHPANTGGRPTKPDDVKKALAEKRLGTHLKANADGTHLVVGPDGRARLLTTADVHQALDTGRHKPARNLPAAKKPTAPQATPQPALPTTAQTPPADNSPPVVTPAVHQKALPVALRIAKRASTDRNAALVLERAKVWANRMAELHADKVAHRFGGDREKARAALYKVIVYLSHLAHKNGVGGSASGELGGLPRVTVTRKKGFAFRPDGDPFAGLVGMIGSVVGHREKGGWNPANDPWSHHHGDWADSDDDGEPLAHTSDLWQWPEEYEQREKGAQDATKTKPPPQPPPPPPPPPPAEPKAQAQPKPDAQAKTQEPSEKAVKKFDASRFTDNADHPAYQGTGEAWDTPTWHPAGKTPAGRLRWVHGERGTIRTGDRPKEASPDEKKVRHEERQSRMGRNPSAYTHNPLGDPAATTGTDRRLHLAFGERKHSGVISTLRPPMGTTVKVTSAPWKLHLDLDHPDADHWNRTIHLHPEGHFAVSNNLFFLKPRVRSGGLGTKAFAAQVQGMLYEGGTHITTSAGKGGQGGNKMNGYYTWARLGYDAPLESRFRRKLPDHLKGAQTVQDLMATPDGAEMWKKGGYMTQMKFDTTPGSRSVNVLNAYLKSKGMPELEHGEDVQKVREQQIAERKARFDQNVRGHPDMAQVLDGHERQIRDPITYPPGYADDIATAFRRFADPSHPIHGAGGRPPDIVYPHAVADSARRFAEREVFSNRFREAAATPEGREAVRRLLPLGQRIGASETTMWSHANMSSRPAEHPVDRVIRSFAAALHPHVPLDEIERLARGQTSNDQPPPQSQPEVQKAPDEPSDEQRVAITRHLLTPAGQQALAQNLAVATRAGLDLDAVRRLAVRRVPTRFSDHAAAINIAYGQAIEVLRAKA